MAQDDGQPPNPSPPGPATQELLARALEAHPELVEPARRVFEYTNFLLDDDALLTKNGALNGEAKELLRKRILEVLG